MKFTEKGTGTEPSVWGRLLPLRCRGRGSRQAAKVRRPRSGAETGRVLAGVCVPTSGLRGFSGCTQPAEPDTLSTVVQAARQEQVPPHCLGLCPRPCPGSVLSLLRVVRGLCSSLDSCFYTAALRATYYLTALLEFFMTVKPNLVFFCFLQKQDPAFTYEVIVVDDGSQDQTSKVSKRALRIAIR